MRNEGIEDIWNMIKKFEDLTKKNKSFEKKRHEQNKFWLIQTIEDRLKLDFFNRKEIKKELQHQLQLIEENKTTPFVAAELLLGL